jgi:hypothetical protein
VPLTEPYVRFTHTAPWIDRSEPQRKLGRYRRRAGVGTSRLLVPRYMRQNVPPPGYVRWLDRSAPRRGCRRSPGPIVVVPSFSIHLSLRSVGFHRLRCYYEEIRLPRGLRPVVVASSGSTARAGPRGSPWVRTLNVPQRPPPLPPRPRLDFGLRVRRHARPAGPACSGVHSRSVPRFASGFFPTRPHGDEVWASHDGALACGCLRLAVATNAPREGLSPPIQCPCQAHLRTDSGAFSQWRWRVVAMALARRRNVSGAPSQ